MIKAIKSDNKNDFFNNRPINRLVDLSLNYLNDEIFIDILALIASNDLNRINELINLFNSKNNEQKAIYDEIKSLLTSIHEDDQKDNLRGTYLELLLYKGLPKKYKEYKDHLIIENDCKVSISEKISSRTVDIFMLCCWKGLICECKIGPKYFENHDIKNLNELYITSNKILIPYIVSLSSELDINHKLEELIKTDNSNSWVHLEHIKIISRSNINEFLS